MPPALDPSSRSRLPQSCAECRRLKLKCDRNKPCSSCIRRGCASICPRGRMVAKGSRFILADTEQLHEKIDALISRVRQLERALEASHALFSSDPHPLLEEDLRVIATPMEAVAPEPEPQPQATEKNDDLAECVGTLTLESRGTRYFGSPGDFAFAWRDKDGPDGEASKSKGEMALALADLPTELAQMAQSFPIRLSTPTNDTAQLKKWILENALPPFAEAWSLFENFWEHYASQFTPFTRPNFIEQIFSPLYHRSPDTSDKPLGHRLALLFMVFAMGDLLDLTQPWGPSRGLRYYLLSRASLCLDPVLESPTVTALQALHLIGIFLISSPGASDPELAWVQSGMNMKLAFTLGLQHDASKFNLPPDDVENRRYALISALSVEVWQSLSLGRPASQTFLNNYEWIIPNIHSDVERDPRKSPRYWAASFVRDCTCRVLEIVVGTKATSYSAIMQLHAKIEQFPELDSSSEQSQEPEEISAGTILQQTYLSLLKEIAFLFLHRRGFAIALRDYPDNPLNSPFAPSVVACCRGAIAYVSKTSQAYNKIPALMLRLWYFWPNIFVATLVLGSIVARSPGCTLAPSALHSLEKACQLWESASDCVCGGKVLEIVRQLKQKAFMAFAQNQTPMDIFGAAAAPEGTEVLDEIHALGGYGPHVITARPSSACSGYSSEPKVTSDSSQSPPAGDLSDPPSTNLSNPPHTNPPNLPRANPPNLPHANPPNLPHTNPPHPPHTHSPNPPSRRPSNPPSSDLPGSYAPSYRYDMTATAQSTAPYAASAFTGSNPSFPAVPSDWEKYDYSSHLQTASRNTLSADFDDIAGVKEGSSINFPLNAGPTFVEGLGLGIGREWQPVMDHLGL